jgi:hypothetical protein
MDENADIEFDENHPVVVSEAEWKAIIKRGVEDCKHEWEHRLGRPASEFIIVHNTSVERKALGAGRVCTKCGRIEFRDRDRHHKFARKWSQEDLTPHR